jgi:hypothetical protein
MSDDGGPVLTRELSHSRERFKPRAFTLGLLLLLFHEQCSNSSSTNTLAADTNH